LDAADSTPHLADGFRWPAEWEPHHATWISWPHNRSTWPTAFDAAEAVFGSLVAALSEVERVRIGVAAAHRASAGRRLADAGAALGRVDWVSYSTNDAWVRDHGPIFLAKDAEAPIALDFEFDNWGKKYPGWELDNAVPKAVAKYLGSARLEIPFVLEGGSIDGDGRGTILTTESCLLDSKRRVLGRGVPHGRRDCDVVLERWLGAEKVIWLAAGIEGDDTDGHIDDVARFVAPGRVVAARSRSRGDPDFSVLEENWQRLGAARDAGGERLECAELPMPPPLVAGGARLPASYANFYLANDLALVPVFGAQSDETALRALEELLPERRVVPVRCEALVEGLGAIHCCTKEEPSW
jgi:agmatine deiminase